MLTLKYYGHAMWKISLEDTNIILDPFTDIGFPMPEELTADIVISSHDHFDHNNFKLILPTFQKITQIGTYQIKDLKVNMIEASHGKLEEKGLGDTYMIYLTLPEIKILHCGDLGVIPDQSTLNSLKDVDVLLVPVGGKYTIDAVNAKELIEILKPKFVFPMHYKIGKSKVDIIDTIEPFASLFPDMEVNKTSEILLTTQILESTTQRVIQMSYEE